MLLPIRSLSRTRMADTRRERLSVWAKCRKINVNADPRSIPCTRRKWSASRLAAHVGVELRQYYAG